MDVGDDLHIVTTGRLAVSSSDPSRLPILIVVSTKLNQNW